MDKIKRQNKLLILGAILIFCTSSAVSLGLNIEVAELADQRIAGLDYDQNTEGIQEIDFTVENTGSLGCKYQARATFNDSRGNLEEAWSDQRALWPGDTANLEIKHVFDNKTSNENTTLYVEYCGVEDEVDSFNFNVSSDKINESELESLSTNVRNNSATILLEEPADELIPVESPNLWKISSSDVEDRKSRISYYPPIFKDRDLNYHVVRNNSVIGTVEIDLSKPDGLREKLEDLVNRIRLNL